MATMEDKIIGLYAGFFNRAPDKEGFDSWVSKIESGAYTLNDIARGFAGHPFFEAIYDGKTTEDYVNSIYTNMLGSSVDADGLAYYTNKLNDSSLSYTRADMVAEFIGGVLDADLTDSAFDSLTAAERTAAQNRQSLMKNKVAVSKDFISKLGDQTNVADAVDPTAHPSYIASVNILSDVTEDVNTVKNALTLISTAVANPDNAIQTILNNYTNYIEGTDGDDRIMGTDYIDSITAGAGNDIIRAGKGVDRVYAGDGDDTIVVIGDLSGGGKINSAQDTEILGEELTNFNGTNLNEDENGAVEIIDGGEGTDTLYVYGTADISNYDLTSIEDVVIRSDVTFLGDSLKEIRSITGDGGSIVRIKSLADKAISLVLDDLDLTFKDIGTIDLDDSVELLVSDLSKLGGAKTLSGGGSIKSTVKDLDWTGYTLSSDLKVLGFDGTSSSTEGATIYDGSMLHGGDASDTLTGTDKDDILYGTDKNETLDGLAGDDVLYGGAGDDIFIVSDEGVKTIMDTKGVDTLDISKLSSGATIDLSTGATIDSTTIDLGSGGTIASIQPVDLYLLQDLSGSFSDDVHTVQGLLSGDNGLISSIRDLQPNTNFGIGTFVDNPEAGGSSYSGDYIYENQQSIVRDEVLFKETVDNMIVLNGGDGPESQLDALYQTAIRADDEIGFRDGALRIVLLTTDATYHKAGDFYDANENNGDKVFDANEDYVSIDQVREAVLAANLYPVFAVTDGYYDDNVTVYEDLVSELGVGSVTTLSSDSSNLIDVIKTAITTVDKDFIDNFIGTSFDDIITNNSLDNYIDAGDGLDTVIFTGDQAEYNVSLDGEDLIVQDTIINRDGTDTLHNVETISFNGVLIDTSDYIV